MRLKFAVIAMSAVAVIISGCSSSPTKVNQPQKNFTELEVSPYAVTGSSGYYWIYKKNESGDPEKIVEAFLSKDDAVKYFDGGSSTIQAYDCVYGNALGVALCDEDSWKMYYQKGYTNLVTTKSSDKAVSGAIAMGIYTSRLEVKCTA